MTVIRTGIYADQYNKEIALEAERFRKKQQAIGGKYGSTTYGEMWIGCYVDGDSTSLESFLPSYDPYSETMFEDFCNAVDRDRDEFESNTAGKSPDTSPETISTHPAPKTPTTAPSRLPPPSSFQQL